MPTQTHTDTRGFTYLKSFSLHLIWNQLKLERTIRKECNGTGRPCPFYNMKMDTEKLCGWKWLKLNFILKVFMKSKKKNNKQKKQTRDKDWFNLMLQMDCSWQLSCVCLTVHCVCLTDVLITELMEVFIILCPKLHAKEPKGFFSSPELTCRLVVWSVQNTNN